MTAKSIDPKTGFSTKMDVKHARMERLWPKDVIVDYAENTSRACLYTYDGKPCCFREDEPKVQERIESLLSVGQITPIKFYLDNRGRPNALNGHLRLFCFVLLTKDGRAEQIPNSHGGRILAIKGKRPESPEDYLELANDNVHDNMSARPTDVDIAFSLRRFVLPHTDPGGRFGLGMAEAGKRVAPLVGHALSARSVSRYMQLLSLPPKILGEIHRGDVSMTKALRDASENGTGTAKGPRPAKKKREIEALAQHLPPSYRDFCRYLLGEINDKDAPEVVQKALAKLKANGVKEARA